MKQVLIIEPEEISARLYESALTASGFAVRYTTETQAALLLLDEQPVDVIVLELDAPWHNGFEFLYEFVSYDDWQDTKVIVHSRIPQTAFSKMKVDWSELSVVEYLYKAEASLADLQTAVKVAAGEYANA